MILHEVISDNVFPSKLLPRLYQNVSEIFFLSQITGSRISPYRKFIFLKSGLRLKLVFVLKKVLIYILVRVGPIKITSLPSLCSTVSFHEPSEQVCTQIARRDGRLSVLRDQILWREREREYFAPVNLVSREGLSRPVPRQPTYYRCSD